MAVEPLYNESKDALLSRVRIKTADDEQVLALVDQKIQQVRLGFFSALTKDRAKEIAGYSLVDNPDSDEEVLKAQAAAIEADWLTYMLAKQLPVVFMADTASTKDNWNEEPLTRDSAALQEFLKDLKAEIDKGLGDLESPVNTEAGSAKSASIGPDTTCLNSETFAGLSGGYGRSYISG